MRLSGKKALITGGNSGIGLATAKLFIAEGAQVAITGLNQERLEGALHELGPNSIGYCSDVTDSASRSVLFSNIAQRFGSLDILFANAGISGLTKAGSTSKQVFEQIFRTNLIGSFLTVEAALPLLKNGSSIIFTGSIDGVIGQSAHAAYAASKAGIRGMARSLATDLSERGIRVNVISPGAVKTPLWEHAPLSPQAREERDRHVTGAIPLGRWGTVDEIAKAVLFLASDDASYVQSIELFVDGGMVGSSRGGPMFGTWGSGFLKPRSAGDYLDRGLEEMAER